MKKIDQAIVLAAGIGKRLRPLTLTTPKPLLPIQGAPIIETVLNRLKKQGVRKVIVNTHHLADQLHEYLTTVSGIEIVISYEPELLETGGGVLKVLSEFSGQPFFAVNADIWWQESPPLSLFQRLEAAWNEAAMDILMALIPKQQAIEFPGPGDYYLNADLTLRFRATNSQAPFIFSGVRLLHPRLFEGITPGFLQQPILFHQAEAKQRLYGLVHDNKWCDIGTLEAYQALETYLA